MDGIQGGEAHGETEEIPVPDAAKAIRAGRDFDEADLSMETQVRLALLGFLAVAAEEFMRAQEEN